MHVMACDSVSHIRSLYQERGEHMGGKSRIAKAAKNKLSLTA